MNIPSSASWDAQLSLYKCDRAHALPSTCPAAIIILLCGQVARAIDKQVMKSIVWLRRPQDFILAPTAKGGSMEISKVMYVAVILIDKI